MRTHLAVVAMTLAGLLAGCAQGSEAPQADDVKATSATGSSMSSTGSAPAATTTPAASATTAPPPSSGATTTGAPASSGPPQQPAPPVTEEVQGSFAYEAAAQARLCNGAGAPAAEIKWTPADLDLAGATRLNLTLQWVPTGDVNGQLEFILTAADKGPAAGGMAVLAKAAGAPPLSWTLDGAALAGLPDAVRLWVLGPDCTDNPPPAAGAAFKQAVAFQGTLTMA